MATASAVVPHWSITIGLMAAATGLTGLIPTYRSIGVWAPVALIVCRLLQGFSTGGEWGGAAAFLVEYAPPGKRGLIGSLQQFSTQIGSLSGVVVGGAAGLDIVAARISIPGAGVCRFLWVRPRPDRLLFAPQSGGDAGLRA